MEFTRAKGMATAILISAALLPKTIYWASDKYIKGYHYAENYISETSTSLLASVGLKTIDPEVEKNLDYAVTKYSHAYNLNPLFLKALIKHESNENADAISLKGAIGYAQIMPDNYKRCGLKRKSELWDLEKNVKCGAQIISEELTNYKDPYKALMVYNGGPQALTKKFPESINHANTVLKIFALLTLKQ